MPPPRRTIPWLVPLAFAFVYGPVHARAQAPAPPTTRPAAQPDTRAADDAGPDAEFWTEPGESPASGPSPVLATAADVRALSPEEAAAARPVQIRGVVTYFSTMPPLLFVQDKTGGVCVSGARLRELRTQARTGAGLYGATVHVEGVTAAGGDVAYVAVPAREPVRLELIEPGRLPFPRSATIAQLGTPALHGEQVEVEGVVRSVRVEPLGPNMLPAKVVTLAHGAARVEAVMFGRVGDAVTAEQWVGAVVRARGVFNAATPEWHGAAATRLLLRSDRDLRVRFPAARAEELQLVPIRTLADAPAAATQPATAWPTRSRVRGVVTLALPGQGVFVQDASGGVWVETRPPPAPRTPGARPADEPRAEEPRPGEQVEVVGFPARSGWSSVLSDAAWTVLGTAPMPDAPLVTAEQALRPGMDARLVRVEAMVLSISRPAEYTTLVLQSGGRVFLARLADTGAGPPPNVGEGTWVRVTGVCVQGPGADAWAGAGSGSVAPTADAGAGAAWPQSFHVMVPSFESVQVVRAPGWWTPQRVLVVCALLATVALVAVSWVVALRRRVARQTHLIREHLAKRTLYEERVRIARDLHDSLEQDLLGITMQLNATEKLLAQPDRARQSLQLAAAMVRRSQAETHRAVWDLREGRSAEGLVPAVREAVLGLAPARGDGGDNGDAAAGPRVAVEVVGEPRELPPQVENHVLRVAVEAVTNALKHAGASRVEVELMFAEGRVGLRVVDDGRGFDAERLPPPSSGHFGLFGMRERAEKLNAALAIRSRPGGGTEIRLDVPTVNGMAAPAANDPARAAGAVAP